MSEAKPTKAREKKVDMEPIKVNYISEKDIWPYTSYDVICNKYLLCYSRGGSNHIPDIIFDIKKLFAMADNEIKQVPKNCFILFNAHNDQNLNFCKQKDELYIVINEYNGQLQFKINKENSIYAQWFYNNDTTKYIIKQYTFLDKINILKIIERKFNDTFETRSIQERLDYLEDQFKNMVAFIELTKPPNNTK